MPGNLPIRYLALVLTALFACSSQAEAAKRCANDVEGVTIHFSAYWPEIECGLLHPRLVHDFAKAEVCVRSAGTGWRTWRTRRQFMRYHGRNVAFLAALPCSAEPEDVFYQDGHTTRLTVSPPNRGGSSIGLAADEIDPEQLFHDKDKILPDCPPDHNFVAFLTGQVSKIDEMDVDKGIVVKGEPQNQQTVELYDIDLRTADVQPISFQPQEGLVWGVVRLLPTGVALNAMKELIAPSCQFEPGF